VSTVPVRYRFELPDGQTHLFALVLDRDTAALAPPATANPPEWTRLGFNQCHGCPLQATTTPHCPAALQLAEVIDRFTNLVSYDQLRVVVETDESAVSADLSAQQGLASLIGLIMASSGCPRTAVFRPMARFHLPFSSETETAYRVAAMYLMARHFAVEEGAQPEPGLGGLARVYEGLHQVNKGMAQRLRAASRQDAIVNAIVLLDVLVTLVPAAIEELLGEIKPAFAALLRETSI
jgi:hypothetical protein